MSDVLTTAQRNALDKAVQNARRVAEAAAGEELGRLGVAVRDRPSYLSDDDAALRRGLRAKARQLGDGLDVAGADLRLLRGDVAYEQWHRLLFARFLAENDLLLHPEQGVPVTLEECAELAVHEGEPDGWMLAARYASHILPGVFRLSDPAVQVRYSPERRVELERIVEGLDADVFRTEDALGWVYQFWQTAEKKRVNDAGDKIGGADLSPVTQLFTENYMVRFLLENSLGAWWAARHPESPLVEGWEYLRRLDDGTPAAGTFDEWPTTAAEVTVMDPCCGSGHFLVAAFGMLWRMRAQEEGLSPADAQDAVLRDNLFGLELDPRCTQIATFNVVFEAWKQGGYRTIPTPLIACSGVPVRMSLHEWLDGIDEEDLRSTMERLHALFVNAETLGSLIDPRADDSVGGELFGRDLAMRVGWDRVGGHVAERFTREVSDGAVAGAASADVVHAAELLAGRYTLIATNPPFLGASRQSAELRGYLQGMHGAASGDLAAAMLDRWTVGRHASQVFVLPQSIAVQSGFRLMREEMWRRGIPGVVARLGPGAFERVRGQVVQPVLIVSSDRHRFLCLDVLQEAGPGAKAAALRSEALRVSSRGDLTAPFRWPFGGSSRQQSMAELADFSMGIQTGDNERFTRCFWEGGVDFGSRGWVPYLRSPSDTGPGSGRTTYLWWENGQGRFRDFLEERLGVNGVRAWLRGEKFWGRRGVLISRVGRNPATIYGGELFSDNSVVFVPRDEGDLGALWSAVSSPEFSGWVDDIDSAPSVTGGVIADVVIELPTEIAPVPEPYSDDPTQWLFLGTVPNATEPLQVAVARLFGYRWPEQVDDEFDDLVDRDGIVALSSLSGEMDAASRLRMVLARAYGDRWSSAVEQRLVRDAGGESGSLEEWLRDGFFTHHCKLFQTTAGLRPFLWQIWDGRKDGFSAIVNYHRLDHATLSKLTFSTLGGWIERQKTEAAEEKAGAAGRLEAALDLQRRLKLILDGEAPYDVYVRWKPMHEQPIGWNPDLDDGVRLNIRPFVEAGVLRSKVNVHWRKDRGKNPDGSERINDLHPTLEERRAARQAVGLPT